MKALYTMFSPADTGETRFIKVKKIESNSSSSEIRKKIEKLFGVSEDVVNSKKKGNVYRKLYLFALRYYSDLSLKEIGELMEMDYSSVSQAVCRFVEEMESDKELKSMVEALKRRLRRF